ncbi:MAG: uracil-DNA glycosylase [Thiotrichaceae bacterium]|nr:uracil-DNA glycosylase [Thiotrichaceae bacterium]PCI14388.1 MAG: uracil-DNA glycosylase [Thiotrichales bacterium]
MNLQQQYLEAMGIETWQRRDRSGEVLEPIVVEAVVVADSIVPSIVDTPTSIPSAVSVQTAKKVAVDVTSMDWNSLCGTVTSCTQCALHQSSHQRLFGAGAQQATWMIIGGPPSQAELQQGVPFVDVAGQLLNAMLAAIGLKRHQVYLTNLLKCRLEARVPSTEEAASCEPYLLRQIELVQPSVMLVMGVEAARHLLNSDATTIDALRGPSHSLPGSAIPLVVTYHPADLLRSPADKRKAWQDLQQAQALVTQAV